MLLIITVSLPSPQWDCLARPSAAEYAYGKTAVKPGSPAGFRNEMVKVAANAHNQTQMSKRPKGRSTRGDRLVADETDSQY